MQLAHQILVPMDKAFDVSNKWMTFKKDRDEIGDMRIFLLHGDEALFKTQVPIW